MNSIADRFLLENGLPPTGCLVNGKWLASDETFEVKDKYTGLLIAEVSRASRQHVSEAVKVAVEAVRKPLIPRERSRILMETARLLEQRRGRFIDTMVAEAGITVNEANGEFDRSIITLELSAQEATRLTGEMVPFAASPGAHNRIGFTLRFPVGVVVAITPFNAPLNTVLHKVGPALAAGNSMVLKPSALTPLTSALLGEALLDAGLPPGFISIVQGDGDPVGTWLLAEKEVAFYTFTGSTRVGRLVQQAAGLRRTQLELGSVASTIVCADAALEEAIQKIANAGLRKAGQVCTSVQRVYVHQDVCDAFVRGLVAHASTFKAGDPRDPSTKIGPMITEASACRAEKWIFEARSGGANILIGGERRDSVVTPTIITEVGQLATVWCEEAFAPLLSIQPFVDLNATFDDANNTPYGLAAGIFTSNLHDAFKAARELRFGTVYINETSNARSDVMPYGGVKESGHGQEGPAYAAREMTEQRLVVFNN